MGPPLEMRLTRNWLQWSADIRGCAARSPSECPCRAEYPVRPGCTRRNSPRRQPPQNGRKVHATLTEFAEHSVAQRREVIPLCRPGLARYLRLTVLAVYVPDTVAVAVQCGHHVAVRAPGAIGIMAGIEDQPEPVAGWSAPETWRFRPAFRHSRHSDGGRPSAALFLHTPRAPIRRRRRRKPSTPPDSVPLRE